MNIVIRPAEARDLAQIVDIYNYYILNTAFTFDINAFEMDERKEWFSHYLEKGPYRIVVSEQNNEVTGYASSSQFKLKQAYHTSVETSIYLSPDKNTGGTGSKLYSFLFESLDGEDVHRAYAGITLPNERSIKFHEKFGFKSIGKYHEVGRKFDKYWNVEWFEKRM